MKKYMFLLLMMTCMITTVGCKKEDQAIWVVYYSSYFDGDIIWGVWGQDSGNIDENKQRLIHFLKKEEGIEILEVKVSHEMEEGTTGPPYIYCRIHGGDLAIMQEYGFVLI